MEKIEVIVMGAGVGGLGAGSWLKNKGLQFKIIDPGKTIPMNLHNGVHYLHSIPHLPFEHNIDSITLTDAILDGGKFYHEPNLQHSLDYSEKVRDIQHPSSIMDVGKNKSVYMPSGDCNSLIKKMVQYIGDENIQLNSWISHIDKDSKVVTIQSPKGVTDYEYDQIISTIPLDKMMDLLDISHPDIDFIHNSIHITNYKVSNIVPNWLINLYIPSKEISIYRASILNGICSVESVQELSETEISKRIPSLLHMFDFNLASKATTYEWKNGKIMSISRQQRESIIKALHVYGIYQIGRFGLWNRKLLIDSTINQSFFVVEHIKYGGFDELLDNLSK